MNRRQSCIVLAIVAALVSAHMPAVAKEDATKAPVSKAHVLGGVELGAVGALAPLDSFSSTGGSLSPFAAYMFNDWLGVMANLHILGLPNKDREGVLDDDATWVLGAGVGPRLQFPIGDVQFYGTFQPGFYTGLAPHSSVTDSSWAFSTGGGATLPITAQLRFGPFVRYNRLYQRVHGRGDARYVTAGIQLSYNFSAPPPPPPPTPAAAKAAATTPTPATGKKIILRGVNFDFDKANIRADARPILDEAITTLKAEGGIAIIAEGHTDGVGTDAYNLALSQRRAAAVKDYLVKGGIGADRIKVEGFGESKPVASNDTADGRAQNRRVELRIQGN
jgi:outer membrane protein OmpA-like peptidoglycan-associated protein